MAVTFKLFTGDWCPHCRERAQFIDQLVTRKDVNLEIHALEESGARREAAKYRVDKIPMVIVTDEHDEVLVQFLPTATEQQITKWLEERMSFDAGSTRSSTTEASTGDVPRE